MYQSYNTSLTNQDLKKGVYNLFYKSTSVVCQITDLLQLIAAKPKQSLNSYMLKRTLYHSAGGTLNFDY